MLFSSVLAFLAAPFMFKPAEVKSTRLKPHQKILMDAANLIETHGWCRYMLGGENGFCVQGAIFKAATGRYQWPGPSSQEWPQDIQAAIAGLISVVSPGAPYSIPNTFNPVANWNNREATSKEEVVGTLRLAAAF